MSASYDGDCEAQLIAQCVLFVELPSLYSYQSGVLNIKHSFIWAPEVNIGNKLLRLCMLLPWGFIQGCKALI